MCNTVLWHLPIWLPAPRTLRRSWLNSFVGRRQSIRRHNTSFADRAAGQVQSSHSNLQPPITCVRQTDVVAGRSAVSAPETSQPKQTTEHKQLAAIKFNVQDHGDRGEDVEFRSDCAEVSSASFYSPTLFSSNLESRLNANQHR